MYLTSTQKSYGITYVMHQPKHILWVGDRLTFATDFLRRYIFQIGVLLVWNKNLFQYKIKNDCCWLRRAALKLTPTFNEK